MRPAQRAQLALLLEVAATPTPGNVDRRNDHPDLRFEQFLAGAVGAADGLADAAGDGPLGAAFERAVAGMAAAQSGGNTQFGALLLLAPLVRAASGGELTPERATAVVEATDVEDAAAFCRSFDDVDVAVGAPPPGLEDVDVRDPQEAAAAVRREELTLHGLLARSAEVDGVAREWTEGFERSFDAAERLLAGGDALVERANEVFLELLAEEPDAFVVKRHGPEAAARASEGAREVLEGERPPDELAAALRADGVNPGTTADLLAAGLYIALERGATV
ncbi:MAG: triphosphoribosyl-dephospho-CoA synthase [Halobacteriales archaeon]|nr:triphosphoribosyl-dephospho-CoA synthase [Halobacteriales archaeon]